MSILVDVLAVREQKAYVLVFDLRPKGEAGEKKGRGR
jgi:hypothetical protein